MHQEAARHRRFAWILPSLSLRCRPYLIKIESSRLACFRHTQRPFQVCAITAREAADQNDGSAVRGFSSVHGSCRDLSPAFVSGAPTAGPFQREPFHSNDGRSPTCPARQILRHLPQRTPQNRLHHPRETRHHKGRRSPSALGKSRGEDSRRNDASARHAAPRKSRSRWLGNLGRKRIGPRLPVTLKSRASRAASPQPR